MRVLGMISGTSYDAIETAVVDLTLDGDCITAALLGHRSTAFTPTLRAAIEAALPPGRTTAEEICGLDTLLGQEFGEAAASSIDELSGGVADLVVSHGQTIYHWVEDGAVRGTLQLGQPAWIAERTGCPVISDLRARDISRGGQGAPLVSLLDRLLLAPTDGPRAALNLGGIANLTVVTPAGSALAYDTGPANALLDAAVRKFSDGAEQYDRDGRRARSGEVNRELLTDLLAEPYYRAAPPKSTGKELFNAAYLDGFLRRHPRVKPDDVVATLTRLTAQTVADACHHHGVGSLVVSGGGVHNPTLMGELRALMPTVAVSNSTDLGVPTDAKEALAFAVLGFLTVHGQPGTLPTCTGASSPSLLGSLTPGRFPLRLPPPAAVPPTRLVLVGSGKTGAGSPTLRDASESDLAAMAHVFHDAWHHAYQDVLPNQVVAGMNQFRAGVLVARNAAVSDIGTTVAEDDNGRMLGWVRHGSAPGDSGAADDGNAPGEGSTHVFSLYVEPTSAGRGIGSRLLHHVAETAARTGASELTLWVFAANKAGRRFYARHGFTADGSQRVQEEFGNEPELLLRAGLPLSDQRPEG